MGNAGRDRRSHGRTSRRFRHRRRDAAQAARGTDFRRRSGRRADGRTARSGQKRDDPLHLAYDQSIDRSHVNGSSASDVTPEGIAGRMDRLPFLPIHLRITSVLGIGTLFDGFDSLSIAGALTMIIATFHIDFKSAGALGSAAFLGQIVGALGFGWLSERIGRKWAFISSLLIFGACSLFAATASNEHELLWARAIQGVGLGAEVPIAAALFNEYARSVVRGKWVMLYETLFIYGLVLAPLAGLLLYNSLGPELGWRVLFGIGGIPALIAIVAIFALPESPRWLASKGRLAEAGAIVTSMEEEARRRNLPLAPPG